MQRCFNIHKSINAIPHINQGKDKKKIIADIENEIDKIQYSFMTKTLIKVGIEGMYLNIIKASYDKSIANTVLGGKKLKIFLKIRTRQECSVLTSITMLNRSGQGKE